MNTRTKKITSFLLMLAMIVTVFGDLLVVPAYAATEYIAAKSSISKSTMQPDEELEVTLEVTGTPAQNVVMPNDIMLLLDKSGSMQMDPDPARFDAMIESAKEFIDLVDFNYHQVGIVDYSGNGQIGSYSLTTSGDNLKGYIDNIQCGGGTYTHDAITKGKDILINQGRENAQPVIVLLTDGEPKSEQWAIDAAKQAKDAGIVFYTIALLGPDVDVNTSKENLFLKELATSGSHHHFVLGSVGLIDIYRTIVKEIGVAAAYNVEIKEVVSDEFEIIEGSYTDNIPTPTVSGNTLSWDILELKEDTLTFNYKVRLKDQSVRGTLPVTNGTTITYDDYAKATHTLKVTGAKVTVQDYAPVITDITPAEGYITGGEVVTITGENFQEGATVKFGNLVGTDVQVVSETEIVVTTPVTSYSNKGEVTVTVTNPDKQVATGTYVYKVKPAIKSVTPAEGPFEGGTSVTIIGENIDANAKVYFGNVEAEIYRYYTNAKLIVKSPVAEVAGLTDITIVNEDGETVTLKDAYTYAEEVKEEIILAPVVTALTPATGDIAGGETVTITGENFQEGAVVKFGNLTATNVVVSATEITVTVPATIYANRGEVTVTVINPDKQEATGTYLYTAQPEITSVTPAEGPFEGGTTVTIIGKNIDSDATILFGNVEAEIYRYYTNAKVVVKSPVAEVAGLTDITIINADGLQTVAQDAFTYATALADEVILPPVITAMTPDTATIDGGELATITGENFQEGAKVKFNDDTLSTVEVVSAEEITFTIPTVGYANRGEVTVTVINPDKQEATTTFTYKAMPELTSVSPVEGPFEGGTTVTILGKNIDADAKIYFGNVEAEVYRYYSNAKVLVKSPVAEVAGLTTIKVVNADGEEAVLEDAFTYAEPAEPVVVVPTITSLNVTSGSTEGGETVYVNGTNFEKDTKIYFGDQEAEVQRFYSAARLIVITPENVEGLVDVKAVSSTGGEGVLEDGFEYIAPEVVEIIPTITSLSATTGLTSGGENIYIYGTNFDANMKVYFGDMEAELYRFYSDTRVIVKVPASSKEGIVDVKVVHPTGTEGVLENAFEYTFVKPTISKLTVVTGYNNEEVTTTMVGTNFEEGMRVFFGDEEATSVTVSSKTRAVIVAPTSSAVGAVDVKVVISNGQEGVLEGGYTYMAPPTKEPTLTSISITTGKVTGNANMYLYGTNLTKDMSVFVGDNETTVYRFYSDTRVIIKTPASATTGTVDVRVVTADGEAVLKDAFTYTN